MELGGQGGKKSDSWHIEGDCKETNGTLPLGRDNLYLYVYIPLHTLDQTVTLPLGEENSLLASLWWIEQVIACWPCRCDLFWSGGDRKKNREGTEACGPVWRAQSRSAAAAAVHWFCTVSKINYLSEGLQYTFPPFSQSLSPCSPLLLHFTLLWRTHVTKWGVFRLVAK